MHEAHTNLWHSNTELDAERQTRLGSIAGIFSVRRNVDFNEDWFFGHCPLSGYVAPHCDTILGRDFTTLLSFVKRFVHQSVGFFVFLARDVRQSEIWEA